MVGFSVRQSDRFPVTLLKYKKRSPLKMKEERHVNNDE